jgi:hypothetical protein
VEVWRGSESDAEARCRQCEREGGSERWIRGYGRRRVHDGCSGHVPVTEHALAAAVPGVEGAKHEVVYNFCRSENLS